MDENEKKDKKKSELDQEQIEASKKELAKLKTAIASYSKAAAQLVTATAMKPIHTTIEQISEKYEAAKDEVSRRYGLLVDVETRRGQQNAKIGTKAADQREDSKKVRDEQLGRSRSAILSTEARMKDAGNGIKTFFGSAAARMAKTPFTFAARWQALRGNEAKAKAMSKEAADLANRVMGAVGKENKRVQRNLGKRITAHKNVVENSESQKARTEARREAEKAAREDFEQTDGDSRARRTLKVAIGLNTRMRAGKGYVLSEIARKGREFAGRTAAVVGRTDAARSVGKMSSVDARLRKDMSRNSQIRQTVQKNLNSVDYNRGRVARTAEKIDEGVQRDQRAAEKWVEEQSDSRAENLASRGQSGEKADAKISRRERHARAVTKLALGMDKIQDLRSKGELKVVGMGATVLALMGKRQEARGVVTRAQERINGRAAKDGKEEIVGYQQKGKAQREVILSVASRAFNFRDRKAQDIDKVVDDVKAIPETVKTAAERGAAKVEENYHRGFGKVLSALRSAPAALAQKLDEAIIDQDQKAIAAHAKQDRIAGKDSKDEGAR